jgi:predicted amidophosphoribosyltransferase
MLMFCPACGNKVSTQAPVCPQCGQPIASSAREPPQKSGGWGAWLVKMIALGVIGVGVSIVVRALLR